jgi:hypothetical protein
MEARRRGEVLAGTARPAGHAETDEHVFEQLIVGFNRGCGETDLFADLGEVHDQTGFGGGELEKTQESAPVLHEGFATDFLLQVRESVAAEEVGSVGQWLENDAGEIAVSEALFEIRAGKEWQ